MIEFTNISFQINYISYKSTKNNFFLGCFFYKYIRTYKAIRCLTCFVDICIHKHYYWNTSQSTKWGTYWSLIKFDDDNNNNNYNIYIFIYFSLSLFFFHLNLFRIKICIFHKTTSNKCFTDPKNKNTIYTGVNKEKNCWIFII